MRQHHIAMAIAAAFPFLATAQSNELPVIVVTASPVIESNTTDSFTFQPEHGAHPHH